KSTAVRKFTRAIMTESPATSRRVPCRSISDWTTPRRLTGWKCFGPPGKSKRSRKAFRSMRFSRSQSPADHGFFLGPIAGVLVLGCFRHKILVESWRRRVQHVLLGRHDLADIMDDAIDKTAGDFFRSRVHGQFVAGESFQARVQLVVHEDAVGVSAV